MKQSPVITIIYSAVLWVAAICLCAASGALHPACYAYSGTIAPVLFALIYVNAASKMKSFGVAAALNGFLLVLFNIVGEADLFMSIGLVVIIALSEILRKIYGYDTKKGTLLSFLPLAFTMYSYTAHWWIDTEGSLKAAVEEMPAGYSDTMAQVIANTPMLIVGVVLVIPVAILSVKLAEKILKK